MSEALCKMERQNEEVPLTVGEKFVYVCQGNFPTLDMSTLELRLEEKDKYALKVFKVEQPSSSELRLESTSYVVGEHDLKAAQLTDAENAIVLGGIKFKTETVQNPDDPVKEPFPPVGPLNIFPWLVLILIVAGVLVLTGVVLLEGIRAGRRRRLMQEIDQRSFQYGPMQEFYRSLRTLQRQYLFLSDAKAPAAPGEIPAVRAEIDTAFRLYLARGHRQPAHKWPTAKLLGELKASKMDRTLLAELRLALAELDRARNDEAQLSPQDLEQILKLLKAFVDRDDKNARGVETGAR